MYISRRRFLALSATFTVAACSSDGGSDDASPSDPSRTASETVPAADTAPSTTAPAPTTSTAAPDTDPPDTDPPAELDDDPFSFGVGSGDPDDKSVVIWTRLDGDLPPDGIDVSWTFVGESGSRLAGMTATSSDIGGAVHALITIDEPGSFVFEAGGWRSPTGRTAPIDASSTELRIASAGCQHFETGFYAAHRDIAEWSPDLVVFLGDFIYEGSANEVDGDVFLRSHEGAEPTTLDGYRARYATYLGDPQLQASRAAAPWLVIWDDHEVENNYAGSISQNDGEDPAAFVVRRLAAYQAWWENTPTRLAPPNPEAPDEPYEIHRGLDVGDLVRISALDGRQYRDDQISTATLDTGPPVEGWDDPTRTMLGDDQEAWLADRFSSSSTTWNCLVQQTILGDTRIGDVQAILNYDQWDGYHPARERLLADAPPNLITLTGDIHLAGVGQLGPVAAPTGVEFVTTSISSVANVNPDLRAVVLAIPAIVDAELELRGYTRHTVTPDTWSAEYRQVVDIADPDSAVQTWKTFEVRAGSPTVTEI